MPSASSLNETFGDIDIYLFDQLLKGRLAPGMRILDAGCGGGRNLVYMLQNGFNVHGVDTSGTSIASVRALAARLAPDLPATNFRLEPVERMPFNDDYFDAVICSAVLHFAAGEEEWHAMVREMWRVLKPGGVFFARLASTIGIEALAQRIEGRRYHLPDGSDRFLVDEVMLRAATESLRGTWLEPLKTVVVANLRSMSTWCLMKS
ncbi:MAG: class I SAM-dependent methyltransferase [Bacteroidetes bacterium]|nr:class I SAM-dependent methyltransferase [Bacteroidota bacterium]